MQVPMPLNTNAILRVQQELQQKQQDNKSNNKLYSPLQQQNKTTITHEKTTK